jgi:DNA primase
MTTGISTKIPSDAILSKARQLKRRTVLVAVAGHFTRLRRSRRQLLGPCPLHSGRYPSFHVDPDKQVFYCDACGANRDVFDLVMLVQDLPFSSAVDWINDFMFRREIQNADETRADSLWGCL